MNNELNSIDKENRNEYMRITAAQEMLSEAQVYDQQENSSLALYFYRICVDFLLEELMYSQGTDQSRHYLREKCTKIMDRIDILKAKVNSNKLSNNQKIEN